MQRIAAVWHASPQKMVGVLFALLLAAGMAVGSGANFNATSANAGNTFTSGTLSHSNNKNGAILTASLMKPGDSQTGTVDIKNTGDIAGVFSVAKTVTAGDTAFANQLDLKIEDLGDPAATPAATPATVYNGKLGTMPTQSNLTGAAWAAGATHQYKFTVTFPNTSGANGQDNGYMGKSSTVRFDWESTS
jgi:spore coat-associated protein N